MKNMHILFSTLLLLLIGCGSDNTTQPEFAPEISINPTELSFSAGASEQSIGVIANSKWTLTSDQQWCTPSVNGWSAGESILKVAVASNKTLSVRTAILTFSSGTYSKKYTVTQEAGKEANYVPVGYNLVWQDEFNDTSKKLPSDEWWSETGNNGWGNNELQNYVDRVLAKDTVAKIQNGNLIITASKLATPYQGSDIISARINTVKSWTYGYFEMSAKVPGGKGTWAAFWMMPKNFTAWPLDGEIDIMEYVGYDKNVTHSAVHTQRYNHVVGTQKEAAKAIIDAETDFHVYGLEWTANEIISYVDGVEFFRFANDRTGNKETWPFDQPFYVKLNLAIGGNWGGVQGVDPAIFPARYEIDYVRVYQK